MSIVSSRAGMHKEVVPLGSNGIPIVVSAQFIECAKILNSCRYVETNSELRCAYHPRLDTKADTTKTGIECGALPCTAFG